jgi:PAS domain S-box-containing protein
LTQGLAAQVSARPELGEAEFADVAPIILAGRTGIRAIHLAKNTVVSHIYPREGNFAAQGLRLLEVAEQRAAVERALETRQTVVAGPVHLVQGGVAFVSRTPIYLTQPKGASEHGSYWGLASILIDTETVFREAGLLDHAAGLQYSLRGKDGLGAQGAVFFGDATTFNADPVLLDVSLPNGGWQLAAVPVGGWSSLSPRTWTLRISGVSLAVVAAALAFVGMRHHAGSRDREERLRLLLEVTQRLTAGLALKTVLSAIAEAAAVVFRGEVLFRVVEGDQLVLMGGTLRVARKGVLKERLRIGESLSGHVAATGEPLIVGDSLADARLIREHRAYVPPGGMAMMCVPIRFGSTVLATLAIYRKRGQRFGKKDLAHAMTLAEHAAIAIRNARLYEETEEALQEQRQFLRQVIDIDANCIFAKDRQGRFTLVNQAMADIYDTTVENLVGKTDADFNPNAEEVARFRRDDLQVMDTLKELSIPESRLTDAQGRVRWMQVVKRPMIGKDGTARHVLGSAADITERKRAEMEAQQARQELAHVARVSTIGELAASLAHELNQPLTGALANARAALHMLKATPPDLVEIRNTLSDIADDNKRAGEVIRRLRGLLRKGEVQFGLLDLNGLIRDVAKLLTSDAIIRSITVRLELDPDPLFVSGDGVHLQQVVLNLLLNAMDAMVECAKDGRVIIVRTENTEVDTVHVSVQDTGTGLRQGAQQLVFEPFYTTKPSGVGMGLAISKSIVQAHGGRIWVTDNETAGATFHFSLPLAGKRSA